MFFSPAAAAYLPLPAFLQAETSPSPAFNSRRVPRSIDGTGRRTSHRRSDYRLTELPVSCTLVPRAPSRLPPCLLRNRASSAFRRGILSAMDRWGRSASSSSCSSSRALLAPDSRVIFLLPFFLRVPIVKMGGRIVVADCLIALD